MKRIIQRQTGQSIRGHASRGQILIEVLIALALLGLIATTFMGAMYTSLQAARVADEQSIALTIAKSQIEFVRKQQGFADADWDYTADTTGTTSTNSPSNFTPEALDAEYAGYSVAVTGTSDVDVDGDGTPDEGIRLITATVFHEDNEIFTLQDYKSDR